MATYNQSQGLQSILDAALGKYQHRGFRLVEDGDHILNLFHHDELVSTFSQGCATTLAIHEACRAYTDKTGRQCPISVAAVCTKPENKSCTEVDCEVWLKHIRRRE